MRRYRTIVATLMLCAATAVVVVCTTAPPTNVVNKPLEPAPIAACCTATGHRSGNIPFILGGNCFCTPSKRVVDALHADGLFLDIDFRKLTQLYEDAGIATDFDHRGCNNMCEKGPHVAFGGKCMATPTPGTKNYERVLAVTADQIAAMNNNP
jgi:hypothetical protein